LDARTVKDLYVDKGLPRDKIALILGVPHSVITKSLKQSRVIARPPRTPIIVSELTLSRPRSPRIESIGNRVIVRHQIRLTLELAYLLGWVIGDGHANRREIDAIVSMRESELIEVLFKSKL